MSLNLFRISLCLAISVDKIHLQKEINTEFSLTDKFNVILLVSSDLTRTRQQLATLGSYQFPFPKQPMKGIETTPQG